MLSYHCKATPGENLFAQTLHIYVSWREIVFLRQATLSPAVRFLVETNRLNPALITPTGPKSRLLKGLIKFATLTLLWLDVISYNICCVLSDVLKYLAEVKEGRAPPSLAPTPVESSGTKMPPLSQTLAPQATTTEDKPYVDTPLSSMRKTIAKRLTLSKVLPWLGVVTAV